MHWSSSSTPFEGFLHTEYTVVPSIHHKDQCKTSSRFVYKLSSCCIWGTWNTARRQQHTALAVGQLGEALLVEERGEPLHVGGGLRVAGGKS